MRTYLKNAKLVAVAPPATVQAELQSRRIDVIGTDFPASTKMNSQFDWSATIAPPEALSVTPYAYVMNQGDQIWLNYVNLCCSDHQTRRTAEGGRREKRTSSARSVAP